MIKLINLGALIFIFSAHLTHAAEFPTTWQELVGKENLAMMFVGNSTVYGKTEVYVANIADDTSLFETIKNPQAPDKFQKYQLTKAGLFYNLKFSQSKQIQGTLGEYEKQETNQEIKWVFKGKNVVHQFIINKETGALKIRADLDGHRHAEVNLVPQSSFEFYTNYIFNIASKTLLGK